MDPHRGSHSKPAYSPWGALILQGTASSGKAMGRAGEPSARSQALYRHATRQSEGQTRYSGGKDMSEGES
jgi:hypothetical protein